MASDDFFRYVVSAMSVVLLLYVVVITFIPQNTCSDECIAAGYNTAKVLTNYECYDGCYFAEQIIYENNTATKPSSLYYECVEMCINDTIDWRAI